MKLQRHLDKKILASQKTTWHVLLAGVTENLKQKVRHHRFEKEYKTQGEKRPSPVAS